MDEDELLKDAQEHNRGLSIVMLRRLQLYSSFWFDNYEQVMELRNEVDENTIRLYLPGLFGGLLVCFHNSLAAISMYHKTKSRKYYKIASQLRGHISAAVEVGVSRTELLCRTLLSTYAKGPNTCCFISESERDAFRSAT